MEKTYYEMILDIPYTESDAIEYLEKFLCGSSVTAL